MKINRLSGATLYRTVAAVFAAMLVLTACIKPIGAAAETYAFVTQFIRIDVPDDTLVMTQSTSKYDEVWEKAGISDADSKLDEIKNMGVVAAFYDPESKSTVNFIYKKTAETIDKFSFMGLTDDDIISYMSTVTDATAEDGLNVTISIRRDLQDNVPFFRLVLDARDSETPCSEVIYGTMINGQMLQFDSFTEGMGEVDDAFAEEVVRGITFTQILTPAEYDAEVTKAKIKLGLITGGIIVVIALLIFFSVFARKHKEKRAKAISAAMTDFRVRLKNGEVDTTKAPHFTFTTQYDTPMMEEFGVFSAWFNPEPGFALAIVLFAAGAVFMFKTEHFLYALLLFVLVVVLLYMHYNQSEKDKKALIQRYSVKEKPTAVFKFYDEYFTVSGLSTASEYIYGQITKVRSFKNSVYIFAGDSHALIIRKEDLGDTSVSDLKKLIYKK